MWCFFHWQGTIAINLKPRIPPRPSLSQVRSRRWRLINKRGAIALTLRRLPHSSGMGGKS